MVSVKMANFGAILFTIGKITKKQILHGGFIAFKNLVNYMIKFGLTILKDFLISGKSPGEIQLQEMAVGNQLLASNYLKPFVKN